jgi:hypothetical protein
MGFVGLPLYGELDLGSAIEKQEKTMEKIKTNKYDKHDLLDLVKVNTAIIVHLIENDD